MSKYYVKPKVEVKGYETDEEVLPLFKSHDVAYDQDFRNVVDLESESALFDGKVVTVEKIGRAHTPSKIFTLNLYGYWYRWYHKNEPNYIICWICLILIYFGLVAFLSLCVFLTSSKNVAQDTTKSVMKQEENSRQVLRKLDLIQED